MKFELELTEKEHNELMKRFGKIGMPDDDGVNGAIKRMIKAKRPTQKQMLMIMTLSLQASIYEKLNNEQAITKMTEIYGQLSNLAATLCEDKKLDEKFWSECISFTTLQNFISELIKMTQEGPIKAEDVQKFR